MKNNQLRKLIASGTLLLAGLMIVQIYWFKRAFDVAEKQFDHSIQIAMKKVADSITRNTEIKKLSSNFYVANTESEFNVKEIDGLLKEQFHLRNLQIDYELGIYSADDDTIVYGNYVEASRKKLLENQVARSQFAGGEKNFAVYFPAKNSYLAGELNIWIFSTVILVLMSCFFAYAIISLLRERRFSDLKNDFINNMTHEFKTPVTNIGIAGQILKTKTQEGAQVYVDVLLKENEKLRQKIDQVLLGASVEGLRKPVFESFDIHQIISDCADAFHLKLQERSGSLTLQFSASNPQIIGDRELLTQAFSNIIDNAEKYSRHQPKIFIRTNDTQGGIEIDIADEGIGIEPSMTKKVFEKFFRVPSGDVHNVKGFGLGLNFVRQVIKSHRGNVNLFSQLNKGTEVKIYLPKL